MTKILVLLLISALSSKKIGLVKATENFTCDNGHPIPIAFFCDGANDCDDGSDERKRSSSQIMKVSLQEEVNCTPLKSSSNGSCMIHRDYICQGIVACSDVTPCDVGCESYYRCADKRKCFPRSTVCDGDSCNGCPEDEEWDSGIGFKCLRNGRDCILPQELLSDNIRDCDGGEDLCYILEGNTKSFDDKRCFKCLQNAMIIPRSKVCDHVIDCADLSDECLCEGKVPNVCQSVIMKQELNQSSSTFCEIGEVKCGDGKCIQRTSICDGIRDCYDAKDESYEICGATLRCRDGNHLTANQTCRCDRPCSHAFGVICDGIGDCPVPLLDHAWMEEPGYPDDECRSACNYPGLPKFQCLTSAAYSTSISSVHQVILCEIKIPSSHHLINSLTIPFTVPYDNICDGIVHCTISGEDESISRCPDRFRCKAGSKISIASIQVCDGIPDCDNFADEVSDKCADKFFCPSLNGTKISIDRKHVCDFKVNCDDASDEMHCDDGRFYCENGSVLFVTARQMFDGRVDCDDWSDECPLKTKPPDEDIFSSRYELIANPVLRIVVWIMGVTAVCANVCVIFGECRRVYTLTKKSFTSSTLLSNHMLVLNLALADLLMGIYLLLLGSAGAFYSGTFCVHRLSWLSSNTCSALGVLIVTSSETSVITMVILTSLRLHAVFRPFKSARKPSPATVLCLVIMSWVCSLTIALLPLLQNLEDFFVDRAILRDVPFFDNIAVDFQSARNFVEKLQVYGSKNPGHVIERANQAESWRDLINIASRDTGYPEYVATSQWIGYYSSNSVCIPKLFVTPAVAAWSYSFGIILFNFLSFLFVTFSYVIIFTRSKKPSAISKQSLRSIKASQTLQRRIIRLIVTDFCCWVPVSVMTFMNFVGIQLPEIAYVISAAVLLPINSALNPILYSSFFTSYMDTAWRRTTLIGSTIRLHSSVSSSVKTATARV